MTNFPRLKGLTVSDFRSIAGEWTVPLDAGAVLIHGYNGAGKTSLLSALELACTGRIAHLDDAGDQEYKRHLHHRGTASAQVTMSIETSPGVTDTSTLRIDDQGTHGDWLLTPSMSEFFTERCFLPQATLARLLEIYVPRDARASDTGLIRFVKELLGLDSLDSLIEGLDASGHIARAERVSTDWQVAKSMLDERQKAVRQSAASLAALQSDYNGHRTAIGERFASGDEDVAVHDLVNLADAWLAAQASDDDRVASMRESALRLDGAESLLAGQELDLAGYAESVAAAEDLRSRYAEWQANRGQPLIEWSRTARPELDEIARIDADVLSRALAQAVVQAEAELSARRSATDSLVESRTRLNEHEGQIVELSAHLAEIDERRSGFTSSTSATELSGLLAAVLNHVPGDVCPVCDQHFSSEGDLGDHIRSKILDLNRAAESLLELEGERARTRRDLEAAKLAHADAAAEVASLGSEDQFAAEVQVLTDRLSALRMLTPLAESGHALRERLLEAEDAESARTRAQAVTERATEEISLAARLTGVKLARGTPLQQVAEIRAVVQRELGQAARDLADRGAVADHVAALRRGADELSRAQAEVDRAEAAVELLQQQLEEARRRKEAASTLRKRAEELRAQISNRVFDDRLNGAWGTMFRTLVPTEPFMPQFVQRPVRPRTFDVGLETVHRDGTRAASPGAMLSQGNANTAALSLFLALHFAVAPRLPWLVFDDPVQSMDDLHISNFAALIKQLIRNNGRQVMIAVHQRELFDYLMLELSPGSPGEEVLGIRLDRSYGKSSITHTRVSFTPDETVGPSSAA